MSAEKQNIYFVGAGGIGMAALERYFLAKGCKVGGYDRTPSDLTTALIAEGVEISFTDDPEAIPAAYRNPENTLVVYTPAIPDDHKGLNWFRSNGFEVVKRAAVLGRVTRSETALCFAGTHGKTTTSSMAAHLLTQSGAGCNAFLGGVLCNYGTNCLLDARSPYAVIEADEFDRSFHHLSPTVAVITSTDPDHLDIYGTEKAYLESFAHFTELIVPGGALLIHNDLKLKARVGATVKTYTYGIDRGDFHAENLVIADGRITFDLVTPEEVISGMELGVPLEVNVDNAIAACGGVWLLKNGAVKADDYRTAMKTFLGAKRRFEFWMREPGKVIIDDYAHHPDELNASLRSVRRLFPDKRLVVAFQPHLFSRTRDFAPNFASALSQADEVILLPIYPARELPIEGVTSELILRDVTAKEKRLVAREELVDAVINSGFEVLLTVGAGDINLLIPQIVDACK